MKTEPRVIHNRVFLLGLDELYRDAMKEYERDELLRCARETANMLSVRPADVPIEGYYSEDEALTEYFRLMRALQRVPKRREREVAELAGFRRLRQVAGSAIFGPPSEGDALLSVGEDALSVALKQTSPDWTVPNLTDKAYDCAANSSDFSLVALAALSRDAVTLTALRESVVLYALAVGGCGVQSEPEYVWEVDEVIQQRAAEFVTTFNELFDARLPRPVPENAPEYWMASSDWKKVGRCVRIGYDDSVSPVRHYHWAIERGTTYPLIVMEFWDNEIWTTERYRAKLGLNFSRRR